MLAAGMPVEEWYDLSKRPVNTAIKFLAFCVRAS